MGQQKSRLVAQTKDGLRVSLVGLLLSVEVGSAMRSSSDNSTFLFLRTVASGSSPVLADSARRLYGRDSDGALKPDGALEDWKMCEAAGMETRR